MKLISMTDFVLRETNNPTTLADSFQRCVTYANFLKKPLKLEMFVPCDDNGNVLECPIDFYYKPDFGCQKYPQECYEEDLMKYEQAKEKVLFEEFEIIDNEEDFIEIHFSKENIWISIQDKSGMVLTDGYKVEFPIKKIEDLIYYNILLTPNAIKQLKL